MRTPAPVTTCFATSLSKARDDASAPGPVNAMRRASSLRWMVPSSPSPPCSASRYTREGWLSKAETTEGKAAAAAGLKSRSNARSKAASSSRVIGVPRSGRRPLGADGPVARVRRVLRRGAWTRRRLGAGSVVAGFGGATADAFTLFERFEGKLKDFNKNLARAAVELAKDWRTDRFLRRLEALLVVADKERTLILSGTGDVVEPDEGVAAIGSGGPYAQAAAGAPPEPSPPRPP